MPRQLICHIIIVKSRFMMEANRPESQPPVLEADNVSLVVESKGKTKKIVDAFSFGFFPGRLYCIMGPSGAGKTSLLRLFNRLSEVSEGLIVFRGEQISRYDPCYLRKKVGYLFQAPYLFPGTVRDNLYYVGPSLTDDRMKSILAEVNMGPDFLTVDVDVLSGGEKQRIALARLLILNPEVLLLDEPTSALDEKNANLVSKIIRDRVVQMGITSIIVTHEPKLARSFGGDALLLINGRLVESGPVQDLLSRPETDEGRSFISEGEA